MTSQSLFQSREQMQPLLAQTGKIAANATKGLCSSETAEAARDFLLHFDHAQVMLGLTIIKRNREVLAESQYRLLIVEQSLEQIWAAFCLRRPFLPLAVLG